MKEHILAALVNELTACARLRHNYGCLRELLGDIVQKAIDANEEWYKNHPEDKKWNLSAMN